VSGAVTKQLYLNKINKACFKTEVRKEKEIVIPVDILEKCLNKQEIEKFEENCLIYSVTVIGIKEREEKNNKNLFIKGFF